MKRHNKDSSSKEEKRGAEGLTEEERKGRNLRRWGLEFTSLQGGDNHVLEESRGRRGAEQSRNLNVIQLGSYKKKPLQREKVTRKKSEKKKGEFQKRRRTREHENGFNIKKPSHPKRTNGRSSGSRNGKLEKGESGACGK